MIEADLGIIITPRLSLPNSDQLAVVSITPTVTRFITLIRRRHRSLSSVAERVWALIRALAAQLPAGTGAIISKPARRTR